MNPYIVELKELYGLEDSFLHTLARNGDLLEPLIEMLRKAGDAQGAAELSRLPALLKAENYGNDEHLGQEDTQARVTPGRVGAVMIRPGSVCHDQLQLEAAAWREKVRVLPGSEQDEFKRYATVEVSGDEDPPDDIVLFICDPRNWGGYLVLQERSPAQKVYRVITYKD